MKVIALPLGCGKTKEAIKQALLEDATLVVMNSMIAKHMVRDYPNLKVIPYSAFTKENYVGKAHREKFIIDDVDQFLAYQLNNRVDIVGITCNTYEVPMFPRGAITADSAIKLLKEFVEVRNALADRVMHSKPMYEEFTKYNRLLKEISGIAHMLRVDTAGAGGKVMDNDSFEITDRPNYDADDPLTPSDLSYGQNVLLRNMKQALIVSIEMKYSHVEKPYAEINLMYEDKTTQKLKYGKNGSCHPKGYEIIAIRR